jgi:uncharacterized protein YndB with AHSA1/START domain
MNQYIVKKKIAINAEPSKVWEALTNPAMTKKYFFNCEVFSDWKAGSEITFKGKIFLIKKIEMHGKILEIVPGKRLKYNLGNRGDGGISTVTDELSYENGITTVSVSDEVGEGEGAEKRYKRSVKGWGKVLKGLKALVEKDK